ncbi:GntR family transcriptional regulator [Clavibacter lycopersici]|uniref:GntR family transcriptional regulator n=2 Tax=Clavibacter lycopersici TaxID=2301718 RepID=UPI00131416C9|nr:GntR family transcriptional regulator [Clavibacter lycopersici]
MPNRTTELDPDAVSPSNPGPLHAQLTAALRTRIADGSLPPGAQLPTEAELQERFGISRSVVRQALLSLTAEGLVQRGRGRGSIVAPRGELHRLVQRVSGLSTQVPDVTTRVLAFEPGRDAAAEQALGTPEVHALRRLRSAGGEPIALIHTWLPGRIAAELSADQLTDASLHALLRTRLGITIASGRRQVRAVGASAALASSLRVAEGSPVLVLEGTSLDGAGEPVEVFRTWHRADRFVFDIDVVPGDDREPAGLEPVAAAEAPRATADPSAPSAPAAPATGDLASRAREASRQLADLAEELALLGDADGTRA